MDDLMLIGLLAATVGLTALILKMKKQKRRQSVHRKCQVNPYLSQRSEQGRYWCKCFRIIIFFGKYHHSLIQFINQFDDKQNWTPEFLKKIHMDKEQFDLLFDRIRHRLEPKRNTRPDRFSTLFIRQFFWIHINFDAHTKMVSCKFYFSDFFPSTIRDTEYAAKQFLE